MGRRLAGAATHTLSLPALDDEIEPLHPPKTTTATPTSATQASSGQGPAQHPNSHCRWIRRFTFKPLSLSLFLSILFIPFLINLKPHHTCQLGSLLYLQRYRLSFCTYFDIFSCVDSRSYECVCVLICFVLCVCLC